MTKYAVNFEIEPPEMIVKAGEDQAGKKLILVKAEGQDNGKVRRGSRNIGR